MIKGKAVELTLPKIFAVVMTLFFVVAESSAATYYVSPAGSDSNGGLNGSPFKTIQKAANIVKPGDTVIVKDGTYTSASTSIVKISRSGTANNWITFKCENKWGAVLDGEETSNLGFVFSSNASYIRIEDFEIKNVIYGGLSGSYNESASNLYFYRNKIHDVGRQQVGCSDPNVIYGRSAIGFNTGTPTYLTVDSNIIYNIGRLPGGCTSPAWADYTRDHGMYVGTSHTTVINNIFYNCNAGWPIQVYGEIAGGTSDWLIANNTFYGANGYLSTGQIILLGSLTNITIENNISYGAATAFINSIYSTPGNLIIRNNLSDVGSMISPTLGTLSNNITGQDPSFVDLANKDFHLQAGSPAIDKGRQTRAPAHDFDGNVRPQNEFYDIGAYEHIPIK